MGNPLDNDVEVGRIEKAEEFEESRKPKMFKLWIDLSDRKVQSVAQLGYNHKVEEVEGLQVLCVTDLGEVRIAGFKSEVLTVGVSDEDGDPLLVTPETEVSEGGKLY